MFVTQISPRRLGSKRNISSHLACNLPWKTLYRFISAPLSKNLISCRFIAVVFSETLIYYLFRVGFIFSIRNLVPFHLGAENFCFEQILKRRPIMWLVKKTLRRLSISLAWKSLEQGWTHPPLNLPRQKCCIFWAQHHYLGLLHTCMNFTGNSRSNENKVGQGGSSFA